MTKQPHKHSVYIKAWADGELIEQWSNMYGVWFLNYFPGWNDWYVYRIRDKENGIYGLDHDPSDMPGHRG